jgi:hypothetical protein
VIEAERRAEARDRLGASQPFEASAGRDFEAIASAVVAALAAEGEEATNARAVAALDWLAGLVAG